MAKYIIEGGNKLSGKVRISGNKNAVFPCMAAALLTSDEVILKNIPLISDTDISIEIFKSLGVEIGWRDQHLVLKAESLTTHILPKDLTQKLRGSVVFVGGLLGRLGKAEFHHPGGDVIGKRSIGTHLNGFQKLGFDFINDDLHYQVFKKRVFNNKTEIFFDEASVTATENIVLASVLGSSEVILSNCATEPHIVDLCNLLNLMGAKIEGVGSSTLIIKGVEKLNGVEYTIGPDYLEMGTYAIASAITGGSLEIENCELVGLEPVTAHLKRMGLYFDTKDGVCKIAYDNLVAPESKLHTNIWPGFPSDLMSVAIVLATQAKGVSIMHDWMYESRMFFVDKLISMGANITIADPHRVVVYGPTKLQARNLETPDIRAGMALVLAALTAKGESTLNRAELIERGYEDVVSKLANIGAKIQRVE